MFAAALAAGCGGVTDEPTAVSTARLAGANGIDAELVFDSQWGQGYCARVIVRNDHPSATTGTWSVALNVGAGTTFTTWDAVFSGDTGVVTVTPQSSNAAIPPSETRQFGLCATSPGPGNQPSVNGVSSDLPAIPPAGAIVTEYKYPAGIESFDSALTAPPSGGRRSTARRFSSREGGTLCWFSCTGSSNVWQTSLR